MLSEDGFIEELLGNNIECSFDCVGVVCGAGNGGFEIFETTCGQEFSGGVEVADVIFIGWFWWCKCSGSGACSKEKF